MSALPVPATMDEITPEWLSAALTAGGRAGACSVSAIGRETIGQGVGILGELCRMTPVYASASATAPKSLIAKIPTADPGGKGIAQMLGFYEKEVRFYNEVGDKVGVRTAYSYYAAGDNAATNYVILMEDLGALPIGDQVTGATAGECELLIREMARLHARWWDDPDLDRFDWIPAANAPIIKFASLAYAQSLGPFLEKFGDHLTGAEVEMAQKLLHRMNPMQDEFSGHPATLCHGDLRLDNVFWGSPDDTSPVTLVDWQIAVKARGPYDVGYFLSQSVDPDTRAAIEEGLLRDYHRALVDGGVKGYSFDQCWDDYRITTMFCLAYPVNAGGSIDLANERGVTLGKAMLDRSLRAIADLNAYEVLDRFEPAPLPVPPGA